MSLSPFFDAVSDTLLARDAVTPLLFSRAAKNETKCDGLRSPWDQDGIPVIGSVSFHTFAKAIAVIATALTAMSWVFLSWRHIQHYTAPHEQRQIIRIIFYPTFTAVISMLAVLFYQSAPYVDPVQSMYESFCIASLFILANEWACPDRSQPDHFYDDMPNTDRKGNTTSSSSLVWYRRTRMLSLQYPFTDVILMTIEIVLQAFDAYCPNSFSPKYGHLWVTLVQISVIGSAVANVLEYYIKMNKRGIFDKSHRATARLWTFKGLVFLHFIQGILISIIVKPGKQVSDKLTYNDLQYGVKNTLLCVECFLFSLAYLWAWRTGEYNSKRNTASKRLSMFRAIFDALNLADIIAGGIESIQIFVSGTFRQPQSDQAIMEGLPQSQNNGGIGQTLLDVVQAKCDRSWSQSSSSHGDNLPRSLYNAPIPLTQNTDYLPLSHPVPVAMHNERLMFP